MAKRKIRHAVLTYMHEKDGRQVAETVFRGMIADIPADQVERFDNLGATVAVDEELDRAGTMLTLPEAPTDQELINWVVGATKSEVETLVRTRPSMAPRIANIEETVKRRYDEQAQLLGSVAAVGQAAIEEPGLWEEDEEDDEDIDLDLVVRGNVSEVSKFLSENPHLASDVMEAENRRAAAEDEDPRLGVVRAVEAAAGHAS